MSTVTIKRSDRTMVFSMADRDKMREILKGRMQWDRRNNRWKAVGALDELQKVLEEHGYEVKFVGPPAPGGAPSE